jgi:hypothetical protein
MIRGIFFHLCFTLLRVTVSVPLKAVCNCTNIEIVGSNPIRDMDVRPRSSLLYCPMWVEDLRNKPITHPSFPTAFVISELILNRNRSKGRNLVH